MIGCCFKCFNLRLLCLSNLCICEDLSTWTNVAMLFWSFYSEVMTDCYIDCMFAFASRKEIILLILKTVLRLDLNCSQLKYLTGHGHVFSLHSLFWHQFYRFYLQLCVSFHAFVVISSFLWINICKLCLFGFPFFCWAFHMLSTCCVCPTCILWHACTIELAKLKVLVSLHWFE